MTPEERKEQIGMLAGLALPGVIASVNPLYSNDRDIAKRAYDIARALVDYIDEKETEVTPLNEDYPC